MQDVKFKAKSWIDMFGGRAAKSVGSLINAQLKTMAALATFSGYAACQGEGEGPERERDPPFPAEGDPDVDSDPAERQQAEPITDHVQWSPKYAKPKGSEGGQPDTRLRSTG